jgi:hypothetical protein
MSSGPSARSDFAAGKWTNWLDGFATDDGGKPVHFLNASHLGARPIGDYDQLVADFRTGVANQMSKEFQDAIAASK